MKNGKLFLSLAVALAVFAFAPSFAKAGEADIAFPIAELGSCANKESCKAYCDVTAHQEVCLDFAEKNDLMSKEEIAVARKVSSGEIKGPGGCKTKEECESYCDSIDKIEECVAFAEENNLMSGEELSEARKIKEALKRGVKLPACKNKKECDSYCSSPANMEECMTFAIEAGFMSPEEQVEAGKMLTAIKNGAKPPACRGKEECDRYCSTEEHMEECAEFALKAGFMTEEEYQMMKKTGGRGPGGCRGKEECDNFCNQPTNEETCMNFAIDNELLPPERLKEMEEGSRNFKESMKGASGEAKDCLEDAFGDISDVRPSQENGEKMRKCFEEFDTPRSGPGGCKTREECDAYCKEHLEECGHPESKDGRMEDRRMDSNRGENYGGETEQYFRERMMEGQGQPSPENTREGQRPPEFKEGDMEFRRDSNMDSFEGNYREGEPAPVQIPEFVPTSSETTPPTSLRNKNFLLDLVANVFSTAGKN